MQSYGKDAQTAAKRKREGADEVSRAHTGQPQTNAVEGVAIHFLFSLFRLFTPGFDDVWETSPVLDELEADFMMRRRDWPAEHWVALQMKSSGKCLVGTQTTYKVGRNEYPNVFVVCVGMMDYKHRDRDVSSPDDIAPHAECVVLEAWNVGRWSETLSAKTFGPTVGVPYSGIADTTRRLDMTKASDEEKRLFVQRLLRDVEAWQPRFTWDQIMFGFDDPRINAKVGEMHKIEKLGFVAVDSAIQPHGLRLVPVWRQGECVDYAIEDANTGKRAYVSGKTGTVDHGSETQRYFQLSAGVNHRFCDLVIASYSGAFHKVAVMARDIVYVDGMKTFCWNEKKLKQGVRIFQDVRTPRDGKAFADHIRSFMH